MTILYIISVAALVIALAFLGWQVFRGREAAEMNTVMLYNLTTAMKALAENAAKMDGTLGELEEQSDQILHCVRNDIIGPMLSDILECVQHGPEAGPLNDEEPLNPEAARKAKEAMDKWNEGIAQILNYDPMSKKDGES